MAYTYLTENLKLNGSNITAVELKSNNSKIGDVSTIVINNDYAWIKNIAPVILDTRFATLIGLDHLGQIYYYLYGLYQESGDPTYDARWLAYNTAQSSVVDDRSRSFVKSPVMLLYEFGNTLDLSEEHNLEITSTSGNVMSQTDIIKYNIDDYGIGIIFNAVECPYIPNNNDLSLSFKFKVTCLNHESYSFITVSNVPYGENNLSGYSRILWSKGYNHKTIRIPAIVNTNGLEGYDMLCLYLWYNNNRYIYSNIALSEDQGLPAGIYDSLIHYWYGELLDYPGVYGWQESIYENDGYSIDYYQDVTTGFEVSMSNDTFKLYNYNDELIENPVSGIKVSWRANSNNTSNKYRTWHFRIHNRCASISFILEYYSTERVYLFDNSNSILKYNETVPGTPDYSPASKFLSEWMLPNEVKVNTNNGQLTDDEKYLFIFLLGSSYIADHNISIEANKSYWVAIPADSLVSVEGNTNYSDTHTISDSLVYRCTVNWGDQLYNIYSISNNTSSSMVITGPQIS